MSIQSQAVRDAPLPADYAYGSVTWCRSTPAGAGLCQHDTGRRPLSQSGVQKQAFNWFDIVNDTWHAATNELRLPTRTPWWHFSWPFHSFTRIIHLVYLSCFFFWLRIFFNFYFCRFFKFFSWSVILCNFRFFFILFCY